MLGFSFFMFSICPDEIFSLLGISRCNLRNRYSHGNITNKTTSHMTHYPDKSHDHRQSQSHDPLCHMTQTLERLFPNHKGTEVTNKYSITGNGHLKRSYTQLWIAFYHFISSFQNRKGSEITDDTCQTSTQAPNMITWNFVWWITLLFNK